MQHNLYLSISRRSLKSLFPVLFIALIFSGYHANAQHRRDPWNHFGGGGSGAESPVSGYAITVGGGYDAPLGDLATSFKGAPAFDVNLVNYRGNFTVNLGIGYHQYQPKADTTYFDDGSGNLGSIVYQPFPVYSFYGGAAYNIDISQGFRMYIGLNFGYYFTRYAFELNDQFSSTSADISDKDSYLAPKFGFNGMISSNLGIGVEAKYNIFTPSSGSSENDPLVGTALKSYSVGVVLTFTL